MYFLRTKRRNGVTDRVYIFDKFTARDKAHALRVLTNEVTLLQHPYMRHPQSGAGNCWCARSESDSIHEVVIDD